jgi:hypothetical protein
MHGTEYGYILDGRIRIKVPEIKGSHEMAGVVEGLMAKLQGVAHVHANPLTGNVRVLFDSQVISYYQVFAVINDLRCLNGWTSASPSLAPCSEGVARSRYMKNARRRSVSRQHESEKVRAGYE